MAKTLEEFAELDEEQKKTVLNLLSGKDGKPQKKIILPFSQDHVKFGVVSDNHINSRYFNKKCLDYLYHVFKDEGAQFVVNAGDITDGQGRHQGQENTLRVQGVDKVLELIVNEYPNNGLTTKFITGNHDLWYMDHNGVEIGKLISLVRKDMTYIGNHHTGMGFEGDIQIGKKTMMRLFHPGKGTAKGLSYQPQGIIEALESENKPKILIIGHYHKMDYVFERNVHAFQAGTTEDQSEWMRIKSIQAHMGGFLVDVYINDEGTIDRLKYLPIRRGW